MSWKPNLKFLLFSIWFGFPFFQLDDVDEWSQYDQLTDEINNLLNVNVANSFNAPTKNASNDVTEAISSIAASAAVEEAAQPDQYFNSMENEVVSVLEANEMFYSSSHCWIIAFELKIFAAKLWWFEWWCCRWRWNLWSPIKEFS